VGGKKGKIGGEEKRWEARVMTMVRIFICVSHTHTVCSTWT
jgi:hypothetical protein